MRGWARAGPGLIRDCGIRPVPIGPGPGRAAMPQPEENSRMTRHDSRMPRRLVLLSTVLAASGVRAQPSAYPTNPIRVTVPYPAAGTTDVVARVVAEALSPRLGQPIVID